MTGINFTLLQHLSFPSSASSIFSSPSIWKKVQYSVKSFKSTFAVLVLLYHHYTAQNLWSWLLQHLWSVFIPRQQSETLTAESRRRQHVFPQNSFCVFHSLCVSNSQRKSAVIPQSGTFNNTVFTSQQPHTFKKKKWVEIEVVIGPVLILSVTSWFLCDLLNRHYLKWETLEPSFSFLKTIIMMQIAVNVSG